MRGSVGRILACHDSVLFPRLVKFTVNRKGHISTHNCISLNRSGTLIVIMASVTVTSVNV
jgi:hypothetical protein